MNATKARASINEANLAAARAILDEPARYGDGALSNWARIVMAKNDTERDTGDLFGVAKDARGGAE
jgi:hypothetical protein